MIRFSRIATAVVAAFVLSLGAGLAGASAETSAPAAQGVNQTAPAKKASKEAETAKNQEQRPQHHAVGKDQSATVSQSAGHATGAQQPAVTQ